MTEIDGYTAHCGFCARDVYNPVQPPLMCRITITSDDLLQSMDATYSRVCLDCAVAVIKTLAERRLA